MDLLKDKSLKFVLPAAKAVAAILATDEAWIIDQIVLNGYLQSAHMMLVSSTYELSRITLWGLSNIVCSEPYILEFMKEQQLMHRVISLMESNNYVL